MDNLDNQRKEGKQLELELLSKIVDFSINQRWITEQEQLQIKTDSTIIGVEKALSQLMTNVKSEETASKFWCAIRCIHEAEVSLSSADDEHRFYCLIMTRLFEKGLITEAEKLKFENKLEVGYEVRGPKVEKMNLSPKSCLAESGVTEGKQFQLCRNPLELPPVIKHVFGYLDTDDVIDSRLVSKEWSSAGLGILFTRSKIKFDTPQSVSKFLRRFSKTSFERIQFRKFSFVSREAEMWISDTIEEFLKGQGKYITELKFKNLQLMANGLEQKLESWSINSCISIWTKTKEMKTHDITKLSVSFQPENSTHISVDLHALVCIKDLTLKNVTVNLQDGIQISPTKLTLFEANFVKNGSKLTTLHLNDIMDFSKTTHIDLEAISTSVPHSLELIGRGKLEHLRLLGFTLVNLETGCWEVNKLTIENMAWPETTQMRIKELNVEQLVDCSAISSLPTYIEKLSLVVMSDEIFSFDDPIVLNRIKFLRLILCDDNMFSLYTEHLKFPNLTDLFVRNNNFDLRERVDAEIDLATISNSVKFIHLTRAKVISAGNEGFSLDKLVLQPFEPFNIEHFCTAHVSTKELVLDMSLLQGLKMKAVTDILKHQKTCRDCVQRFYVGPFFWTEYAFYKSGFHFFVDRKANYYVFENPKGRAIEQKEFDLMLQDWETNAK